jgi:hypothetical protein
MSGDGDAAVVDQTVDARGATDFLIAHGGPFYELQAWLHLLHRHNLAAGRRAVLFAAIAWLPLALLSLIGGTALGDFEQRPFLLDFGAYARFILAVAIFVPMEPMAERRLRRLTSHFVEAGLILQVQLPAAAAALLKALRRRDSRIAEIVALLVAYAASYGIVMTDLDGTDVLARHHAGRRAPPVARRLVVPSGEPTSLLVSACPLDLALHCLVAAAA